MESNPILLATIVITSLLALPYVVFVSYIVVLVVQKIIHNNLSDDEYNFHYPFGITDEYEVTDKSYKHEILKNTNFVTTTTIKRTKKGKFDHLAVYLLLLLFPVYVYILINIFGS